MENEWFDISVSKLEKYYCRYKYLEKFFKTVVLFKEFYFSNILQFHSSNNHSANGK